MPSSIAIGFRALGANPVRTFLSMLGVIMGVSSLVAVLALGDGIEQYGREQLARTTPIQTIEVAPRTTREVDGQRLPNPGYPVFTLADAENLMRSVAGVEGFRLTVTGPGRVTLLGDTAFRGAGVIAIGGGPSLPTPPLAAGRFLQPAEMRDGAYATVVSWSLAAAVAGRRGAAQALSDSVRLEDRAWHVVGILAPTGEEAGFSLFVPISRADQAIASANLPRAPVLNVRARRVEEVEQVREGIERWLAARYPDWKDKVTVTTQLARARQARQGVLLFKLLMGAITGISLLVGGIGIMNVLLASVAERTREIGIRKAVGARQRDILVQFLAESVAISGAGSLVGIGLGLGGAFAVTAVMRARTEAPIFAAFTWGTVLVAALAALIVGVVFGTYPARRAARLAPIDAIRHE
jgi:putative ABC transport system permease protein